MMRRGARLLSFLALSVAILAVAACPGPQPVRGGGGATGGAGGGATCDQCPGSDTDCHHRVCPGGQCSVDNEDAGTVCANTPPDGAHVCDGTGTCVECNGNGDCTSPAICDVPNHACVPATCQNNTLDPGETGIDCGGNAVSGCGPCTNGKGCEVATDCMSGFCDASAGGGHGGAGTTGVCTKCTVDNECGGTEWCDTTVNNGTCVSKKPDGEACAADHECVHGHCPAQDGVCCDVACAGSACEACLGSKTGDTTGVCSFVTSGQDFDAECTATAPGTCGVNGTGCKGDSAACRLYSSATVCASETCAGNQDSPADLCNGNGSCVNSGTAPCANNLNCNAGGTACLTTCTPDTDCVSGFFCSAGTCTAKRADGQLCSGDNQCINAHCADGVCCNTACSNSCDSCTSALKGGGTDGACGISALGQQPTPSCGLFLCNGTQFACPSTCGSDAVCTSGAYCGTGSLCTPKLVDGTTCSGANQCLSGQCRDGVCCDTACTGTCQACTVALKGSGANGVCGFIAGGTDPQSECSGTLPVCDGAGTCVACFTDLECGTMSFCTAGHTCQAKGAYDAFCTAPNQCWSNICGRTGNPNGCGCVASGSGACPTGTCNTGTHTCG